MMLSQKLVNQNCVQHDTLVYLFSHLELEKEEKTRADDDRTSVTLRRLMGLFMTFFCNEKPHFFSSNLSSFELGLEKRVTTNGLSGVKSRSVNF